MNDTREQLDVDTFTEWLESLDETRCDMHHRSSDVCTVKPVALIAATCHGRRNLMCGLARARKQAQITGGTWCECGTRASKCWRIIPI